MNAATKPASPEAVRGYIAQMREMLNVEQSPEGRFWNRLNKVERFTMLRLLPPDGTKRVDYAELEWADLPQHAQEAARKRYHGLIAWAQKLRA